MTKMLLHILFFLACLNGYAQADTIAQFSYNRKIPAGLLRQDLNMLRDSLEIIHPALYRFISKQKFNAAFQIAYSQINRPLTQPQFYAIITPFISKVGDLHTAIEPSDESLNYLASQTDLFPFDIRIVNKEVFIASNNSSETSIEVGSRIVGINDQSIKKIISKMKQSFSDEGANETLKLKRIEQRFAFHYHLIYGYSARFMLQYATDKGPINKKWVTTQSFKVIKTNRARNQLKYPNLKSLFAQPPYLTLSIDEEKNLAVMTVKWFQNDVLASTQESFRSFVDSAFHTIRSKNIGNLIIDIRNNGGGESANASYLYSYLTNKPFRFLYAMEANQKIQQEDLKRGIQYNYIKRTGKYQTTDSVRTNQQFFGLNEQSPMPDNFQGKLYLLIDGLTTSAAAQFASLIKLNQRGKLIGENAPGSLSGGSGRGYSYFYLPNSGLLAMISQYRLYLFNPSINRKETGIVPDYRPQKTISDILEGRDNDMEYALKLLTQKRNRKAGSDQ